MAAGADGIVTGVLTPDGALDVEALGPIYDAAREAAAKANRPVALTLHRAFDVCRDPFAALEAACGLDLSTILTSGQAASAPQGAPLLRQLVERAAGRIEILVGAGVSPANLPALTRETGASAFHLSGKQVLDDLPPGGRPHGAARFLGVRALADQRGHHPKRPHRSGYAVTNDPATFHGGIVSFICPVLKLP